MTEHGFCWADLATADDAQAAAFYAALFGWSPRVRTLAGGRFTLLERNDRAFASIYRLDRTRIAHGVPSHWLPYVATPDVDDALARAAALGGQVIVAVQDIPGMARIAVAVDPTGAPFGLWQSEVEGTMPVRTQVPAAGGSR